MVTLEMRRFDVFEFDGNELSRNYTKNLNSR